MSAITYEPIGILHSPFTAAEDTPLQPMMSGGASGRIVLHKKFREALADLQRFSHIVVIYHFHLVHECALKVITSHDEVPRGVFATRSPARPNPIGLSVFTLEAVDRSTLYVSRVDVVDGTPVLDIKPYIPTLVEPVAANMGWLADQFGDRKPHPED
jgi:tRNA-Thr(GGU) m(6)t(6)A37 methyltransferase TsaA